MSAAAAAGAHVTVLDNSPKQLERDRLVAEREALPIETVEGDMADLSMFPDGSFDFIVHPVSNAFVPNVRPVWSEAFRVLRGKGTLIAGFNNPAVYLFDYALLERTGELEIKYALPYSDVEQLTEEEKLPYREERIPFEFSHTLEDQIGGQIAAGLLSGPAASGAGRSGRHPMRAMLEIRRCETASDYDLAIGLTKDYMEWLNMDLSFQDVDAELREFSSIYSRPGGAFLLALLGDALAGGVGLRELVPGICEMKRLFVYDRFRGKGMGRMLCAAVIEEANQLGYDTMRLDTLGRMTAAIRLYESFGFVEIEPYRFNPDPSARYMELGLK